MPASPEPQSQIQRKQQEILECYPDVWTRIVREWRSPGRADRAWLIYSANYLFRTGNVRWAIDPLTLHWRLPAARPVQVAGDLEGLSFILLTHRHADHLDLDLMRALNSQPVLWVVPEYILQTALENGLPRERLIVPKPLETLEIDGIRITPFAGLHWEMESACSEGRRGVSSTGYRVEFSGKRWLFPGDVRTYDPDKLPSFGPVDGLFAHLWLGRRGALNQKPPLLEAFGSFCLKLNPGRIVLTHLNEFGRAADDFWHEGHAGQVKDWLGSRAPGCLVESACLGSRVDL